MEKKNVVGNDAKRKSIVIQGQTPKPKRVRSAYNFFFQSERAKILGLENAGTDSSVAKGKRKHIKTHGKIGFTELVKQISKKWNELDTDTKSVFHTMYEEDKKRHEIETNEYNMELIQTIQQKSVHNESTIEVSETIQPNTATSSSPDMELSPNVNKRAALKSEYKVKEIHTMRQCSVIAVQQQNEEQQQGNSYSHNKDPTAKKDFEQIDKMTTSMAPSSSHVFTNMYAKKESEQPSVSETASKADMSGVAKSTGQQLGASDVNSIPLFNDHKQRKSTDLTNEELDLKATLGDDVIDYLKHMEI